MAVAAPAGTADALASIQKQAPAPTYEQQRLAPEPGARFVERDQRAVSSPPPPPAQATAARAEAKLVENASFTIFRNNPELRWALEFAAFETACHVGEQ